MTVFKYDDTLLLFSTYSGEAGPVRTIRGRAFRIRKISQLENTEENTGQLVVLFMTQLLLEDFPVS